ncbi:hypothetical protein [Sphingobium yanoikuyae]|uniref:hypothetical protein n=1 Tax=Sphingobium yanoikuyae TaxID=13690 RepID=UPI0035B1CDBD
MKMRSELTFFSDAFPMIPEPNLDDTDSDDEIDEVNPGIFGRRLANFVCQGLNARGIAASEPVSEDFGWLVDLPGWGHRACLVCASDSEMPGRFIIILEPHRSKVWHWFKRVDARPCNDRVTDAVEQLLNESGLVQKLEWNE